MDTFKALSDSMAATVAQVGQSVVRVEGRRRMAASGVVFDAGGVIVTSHHVVTRDEGIRVGIADGTIHEATLVGRDPSTDLAVLKIDAANLTAVNWGKSEDAAVGQLVMALGRPGKSVQAALGMVSTLGGEWKAHGGTKIDRYLRPDVVMYPGFSGGPLVAAEGVVLGINTSAMMHGNALTIPAETIARVAGDLLEHGHIKRGYLGVTAQAVRLPASYAEEAGQETGLLIASVEADSPAEQGGMMLGDVIVQLDGTPTRSMEELLGMLNGGIVGTSVPVLVLRGGAPQTLTVTIGER